MKIKKTETLDMVEENSPYRDIGLSDETVVHLSRMLYSVLSDESKSVFDEHFTEGESIDQLMCAIGRSQVNEKAVLFFKQLQEEGEYE